MHVMVQRGKSICLVGFDGRGGLVGREEENISGACAREGSLEFMSRS